MRSIWKGYLSFGLVNIPISIYPATEPRRIDFDYLRKEDLCPVGYIRVCRSTGEEVPWRDIVKGYEYKKGDYVVVTDADFKKADVKKTQLVEIIDFVDAIEIEPKYFEKPYFVEPGKGAEKIYRLLYTSLRHSRRFGIARFIFRTEEHLGAIIPDENGVLTLNQIRYKHEIRKPQELSIPNDEDVPEEELNMALKLIDQMTSRFNPAKYKDTYIEKLKETLKKKAAGKEVTYAREKLPESTNEDEIMKKLRESLKEIQEKGRYAGM